MKPSIGRVVHYTNLGDADGKYPPETQAAIITGLNPDGTVALHIFYKTGQFDMASVHFSDEPKRGHWNWPPRVEETRTKPTIAELEAILNSEETVPLKILSNGEVLIEGLEGRHGFESAKVPG